LEDDWGDVVDGKASLTECFAISFVTNINTVEELLQVSKYCIFYMCARS
jgi:hypothetical protein